MNENNNKNKSLKINIDKSVCNHVYKNEKQNGWGKFICILCKKHL